MVSALYEIKKLGEKSRILIIFLTLHNSQILICLKKHVVATHMNQILLFPTPTSPLNYSKSNFACLSALSGFVSHLVYYGCQLATKLILQVHKL